MGIVVALAIMLSSAGIGLFIAYRVLRAEIDTRPARRQIGYAVVVFAVTMVILIAIGVLLGGPVRRYALEVLFGFLTAALWGVLGWLVAGLVNGGKALVRLPRPPRQSLLLVSVAAFSFSAATSLHRPETVLRAFYHAEVLSAVFYYIVIVVVPPALRERGLIFLGLYLPWRYVRDWEWEGADGLTLTIIRRRTPATLWLYWYPRVSLHIPYDKKGEVEQLLRERVTVSPASPRGGIGGLPHGAE